MKKCKYCNETLIKVKEFEYECPSCGAVFDVDDLSEEIHIDVLENE